MRPHFMFVGVKMHTKLVTLSDQKTISRIFHDGASSANRYFVARAIPNSVGASRFVFAVGKRFGNAVLRNRIKRQAREIIRQNMDIIPSGFDFGIIPRKGCQGRDFSELRAGLLDCLSRVVAIYTKKKGLL